MSNDTNQALRDHKDLFRLVVENLQDHAVFTIDLEGRVATWNSGAEQVLGYEEAEIVGHPAAIIFTGEDVEAGVPQREMKKALKRGWAQDERWHVKKNGERFWAAGIMQGLRDDAGRMMGFVKILRDRTERKRQEEKLHTLNQTLEAEVAERTERVRRLARALNRAEERERRRLAERLHDHLQQLLVAVKFKLSSLMGLLKQIEARQAVEEAEGLLEESIQESRSITVELSPPTIPTGGLDSALQWLGQWLEREHGLKTHVDVQAKAEPPSEDLRTFLYRAARELLLNVVKHAKSGEAWVSLDRSDDGVRLTIEDQGAGFDANALPEADARSGYGLRSLRERCELMGGEMKIDTAPAKGTRCTIRLAADQP